MGEHGTKIAAVREVTGKSDHQGRGCCLPSRAGRRYPPIAERRACPNFGYRRSIERRQTRKGSGFAGHARQWSIGLNRAGHRHTDKFQEEEGEQESCQTFLDHALQRAEYTKSAEQILIHAN